MQSSAMPMQSVKCKRMQCGCNVLNAIKSNADVIECNVDRVSLLALKFSCCVHVYNQPTPGGQDANRAWFHMCGGAIQRIFPL